MAFAASLEVSLLLDPVVAELLRLVAALAELEGVAVPERDFEAMAGEG